MDPIPGVNLAFAHTQVRSWARAATACPVPSVATETQLGNINRFFLAIGDHLIAVGIWLNMRTTPLRGRPELQTRTPRAR